MPKVRRGKGELQVRVRFRVRTPKEEGQAFFEFLRPIASGLQKTLGPRCEVVLHDFTDPAHSIIWIQGNVTGRRVGGSVSEIGLEMIRGGDDQPDKIALVKNTRNGKIINDTTILLRDSRGRVFGCFCINLDVTDLISTWESLGRLVGRTNEVREIPFSDQISDVLRSMIKATEEEIGVLPSTREEQRRFIQGLEAKGGFSVQRSVPTVASYLGVSRPTVYKYLQAIRNSRSLQQDGKLPHPRSKVATG